MPEVMPARKARRLIEQSFDLIAGALEKTEVHSHELPERVHYPVYVQLALGEISEWPQHTFATHENVSAIVSIHKRFLDLVSRELPGSIYKRPSLVQALRDYILESHGDVPPLGSAHACDCPIPELAVTNLIRAVGMKSAKRLLEKLYFSQRQFSKELMKMKMERGISDQNESFHLLTHALATLRRVSTTAHPLLLTVS